MQESSDEQLTTTTSNKTNEKESERAGEACICAGSSSNNKTTISSSRRSSRLSLSRCRHCRPLDKQSHAVGCALLSAARPAVAKNSAKLYAHTHTHSYMQTSFLALNIFRVKYFNICSLSVSKQNAKRDKTTMAATGCANLSTCG